MVVSAAVTELRSDAPRRQLIRRAATVGLLMRSCVVLMVALITLLDPASQSSPAGKWLMAIAAIWSAYRIVTADRRKILLALDCALVLAVCVAIPQLTPDPHFYLTNSAPQAIAGTAVISFAVAVPARVSIAITAAVAAGYAWGSAGVMGWAAVPAIPALYYFALQWLTSALIRLMILRVADAVDRAGAGRRAAELDQQVTDAVWEYDREQLALLHDTAASTLLMVGQGTELSPRRLAAQARRDLELLQEGPWVAPPERIELVGALRDCAVHLDTPVEFDGLDEVWLVGEIGRPVLAAGREVMNNVDRHARATLLQVTCTDDAVVFVDDGVGFDPDAPRTGHGVTDSILDRMARSGGSATIVSAPGAGCRTRLNWAARSSFGGTTENLTDPDRLIERVRVTYGLALVVYALANLAFAGPQSSLGGGTRWADSVLGVAAAAAVLSAVPSILTGRRYLTTVALGALALVTVLQPLLLPAELVGGYTHWAQSSVGWCALPLVLGLRATRGASVLVGYWLLGAVAELLSRPDTELLVNIGLGTASILGVQLFALRFNNLVRGAAADAHAETETHHRLVTRERVSRALRDEYQLRYARLVDNVLPLLRSLSDGTEVGADLQRAARAESRKLRALFDQESTFDHPLMRQVRKSVDTAESRGIDISIEVAGSPPALAPDEIGCLVGPLDRAVREDCAAMRLVVSAGDDDVSLSVVCDGIEPSPQFVDDLRAYPGIDVVTAENLVWIEVHHGAR